MVFLNKALINNFVSKKIISVTGLMLRRKLSASPILLTKNLFSPK